VHVARAQSCQPADRGCAPAQIAKLAMVEEHRFLAKCGTGMSQGDAAFTAWAEKLRKFIKYDMGYVSPGSDGPLIGPRSAPGGVEPVELPQG
jgi:hypothetical protein